MPIKIFKETNGNQYWTYFLTHLEVKNVLFIVTTTRGMGTTYLETTSLVYLSTSQKGKGQIQYTLNNTRYYWCFYNISLYEFFYKHFYLTVQNLFNCFMIFRISLKTNCMVFIKKNICESTQTIVSTLWSD